jgi:NAD-dependent dihydropyrimidine dehydrogenase PreA subunit
MSAYEIKIDVDKCNGEGACKDACPVEVLDVKDGKAVVVNLDECLGCETCVESCELNCIKVTEV